MNLYDLFTTIEEVATKGLHQNNGITPFSDQRTGAR